MVETVIIRLKITRKKPRGFCISSVPLETLRRMKQDTLRVWFGVDTDYFKPEFLCLQGELKENSYVYYPKRAKKE